jgi:enoyl-CoA hydratase/carnithine racemase
MSVVDVKIENHIAEVTLNRPDKMNAVSPDLIEDLIAAGHAVNREDVRAVVLSGNGRAFCAGIDVSGFGGDLQSDPEKAIMPRTHGTSNKYQKVAMIWHELPMPVIAAVHGVCFGAGFQIALGADIRIAHPDTRFSIMEIKWGLVPDMGGLVLMPPLMRADVVRELTYTARQFTAAEAQQFGVLTRVENDPKATALDMAKTIAGKSPSAVRAAKRLFNLVDENQSAEILLEESREQAQLIGAKDQIEAVRANLEKRAPEFK